MSSVKSEGESSDMISFGCKHEKFKIDAVVHRITEEKGGPTIGRCLVIKLSCLFCGQKFSFKGLPVSDTYLEPNVTATGLEARLPIEPSIIDSMTRMYH